MRLGYARVSSVSQNLDRQLKALTEYGCNKIYQEKISGESLIRPQLSLLMEEIKPNDEVVVLDLDRLGRNNNDITLVMNQIREKRATFRVLSLPSFDGVSDPNLKALLNNLIIEIYKYQAEAERTKIKERQRQGIEIAKKNGVYKGRPSKYSLVAKNLKDRKIAQTMIKMFELGFGDSHIAKKLRVSRKTVYTKRKQFISRGTI